MIIGNTKGFIRGKALSTEGHTHDDRYYTETETNSLLAGKAASSHTHDDRYYTESEINEKLSNVIDVNDPALNYVYAARSLTTESMDSGVILNITSCKTSSYTHNYNTQRGLIRVGDYFIASISTFNLNNYVGFNILNWFITGGSIGGGMAGWPLVIRTSVSYNNSQYYTINEAQARDHLFSGNLAQVCGHVIAKSNYSKFKFKCEVITNTAITDSVNSGCVSGIANGNTIKFTTLYF